MDLKQAINIYNTWSLDENQTLAQHVIMRHANLDPDSALDQDLRLRVEIELDRYALLTYFDVLRSIEDALTYVEQLIDEEVYKYSDDFSHIQGNGYHDNLILYAVCVYKRGKYLNAYNVIESWIADYDNDIYFAPHEQDSLEYSYTDLTLALPEYHLYITHGILYVTANGDIEVYGLRGNFFEGLKGILAETALNGIYLTSDRVLRITIPADGGQWRWEVS